MAVLSEHGASKLVQYIMNKEVDEISSAPGVGKKIAQRLVLELAGKIEKWAWIEKFEKAPADKKMLPPLREKQLRDDLSSALLIWVINPTK